MKQKIGKLGEKAIALWLENQKYEILEHNWYCRYGEIDLIAQDLSNSTLCFIEVKTRNRRNWDQNGLLAINYQKQEKLILAAEIFLMKSPHFSELNCRFDIALVMYQTINQSFLEDEEMRLSSPYIINYQNYQFKVSDYIENAF